MSGADLHPWIQLAIDVERARHELVSSIDRTLWQLDATFASTRALRVVAQARGLIHASEVGRSMTISRQAAGGLLKRHVAAGRLRVVDEGWAKSVRITETGRDHMRMCLEVIPRALEELHHVPEAELEELGLLLHRLAEALAVRREPVWLPDL